MRGLVAGLGLVAAGGCAFACGGATKGEAETAEAAPQVAAREPPNGHRCREALARSSPCRGSGMCVGHADVSVRAERPHSVGHMRCWRPTLSPVTTQTPASHSVPGTHA